MPTLAPASQSPPPTSKPNQRYPFATMTIGESFLLIRDPKRDPPLPALGRRIKNAAYHYRPKRFQYRSRIEDGLEKIQVWRIA